MKYIASLLVLSTILWAARAVQSSAPNDDKAWQKDPRGIYKMTKMTGRGGKEIDAPLDQYKICTDDATITFSVHQKTPKDIRFRMLVNDSHLFNYTGKTPHGEDKHDSQIYDSNGKVFSLRWWNRSKTHPVYPENTWVVEHYERDRFSPSAKEMLSLLQETTLTDDSNPFVGRWAWLKEADSEAELLAQLDELKAQGFTNLTGLRTMVIRGNQALTVALAMRQDPYQVAWGGKLESCTHQGEHHLQLADQTLDIQWQGKDFFYYRTKQGKFQLWTREQADRSYYDIAIDMLHITHHQSPSIPSNQF